MLTAEASLRARVKRACARAVVAWGATLATACTSVAPGGGPVMDTSAVADVTQAADAPLDAAAPEADGGAAIDAAGASDGAASSRCTQDDAMVTCAQTTTQLATSAPGDGLRAVHWQVPLGAPPARGWPAVLMFQGSFLSAARTFSATRSDPFGMYAQTATVKALLDAGYAVVAPEAMGDGSTYWDTNIPPWATDWEGSPDHRLMLALFAAIAGGTFGPLDSSRLFATGISSGGYMTSRMAVSYRGRFRALAIESASYATCGPTPSCPVPALPPDHPPTLFLHGAQDTVVPIATMQQYNAALTAQGTPTRVVVDPTAGHQWLDVAPVEVPRWFQGHDDAMP